MHVGWDDMRGGWNRMTQSLLEGTLDPKLRDQMEELADKYGMNVSEFLAFSTYDRVNFGELERMRELLETFRQTMYNVVHEAENLADLPNKELFIATIDGAFNAFQFILPGEMCKLLRKSVTDYRKRQSNQPHEETKKME